jgi:hypothetical protein
MFAADGDFRIQTGSLHEAISIQQALVTKLIKAIDESRKNIDRSRRLIKRPKLPWISRD